MNPTRPTRLVAWTLLVAILGTTACSTITSSRFATPEEAENWQKPKPDGGDRPNGSEKAGKGVTTRGFGPLLPGVGKPRGGESTMMRYFLPKPEVQIAVYEVRILGEPRLHVAIQPLAVPDVDHPVFLDHDFSLLADDNLRVSLSPEGFLQRMVVTRDPKAIEALGKAVGMAARAAAPFPLPLKGDPDFPEFSRLALVLNMKPGDVARRTIESQSSGKEAELYFSVKREGLFSPAPEVPKGERMRGFYYRPLMPVRVEVEKIGNEGDNANDIRGTIELNQVVYVPDDQRTGYYYLPRSMVAFQGYDLNFHDGTLHQVRVARKSEINTVLELPANILKTVTGLPDSLLSFTVKHDQSNVSEAHVTGGLDGDKGGTRPNPRVLKE